MNEYLSEIRKKIRTRESGPAVDSMKAHGIIYRTNHGLSIAEIKSIAEKYIPNHDLATELWKWDYREFKILATFIEDSKLLTVTQFLSLADDFHNAELAEQAAINLAFHSSLYQEIINQLLAHKNIWAVKSGLVLLAWIAQRKTSVPSKFLLDNLGRLKALIQDNMSIAHGISFAIRAMGKRNVELNKKAIDLLNEIKQENNSYAARYIVEEALWELESDIVQDRLKK